MAKRKPTSTSPSTSTTQNLAIKDLTRKRKAQKKRPKGNQIRTLCEVDAAVGALYDAHAHTVQRLQEGAPSVLPERVKLHDGDFAVQALERTLRGL